MAAWVERCESLMIDAGLSAIMITGFTALAMIQCRQPVRRRAWGRLGLVASLIVIPLTWLDFLPRVDLRHPTWIMRTIELHADRPSSVSPITTNSHAWAPGPRTGEFWTSTLRSGLILAYCAGLTLGLGRLVLGLAGTSLLIRRGRPASAHVDRILAELPYGRARQERPGVLVSARVGRPVLVGCWRPTIVIPPELDRPGAEARLRLGLLHELAHAEVNDSRYGVLATATQAVWFLLPQVWWVRSQLRLDAEFLADHRAVSHFGTSYHYAESLVGLAMGPVVAPPSADLATPPMIPAPASRPGGLASALLQRVQMLLKCPFEVEDHVPRGWAIAASSFMVLWTLAATSLTIHDGRERTNEVTWKAVDEAVFSFRLAELAIAPQVLENRLFNLQFRLPPRFRLACEVFAEEAELADMEILEYRLWVPGNGQPAPVSKPRTGWRHVEIVRESGGAEEVRIDGQLAVASHRPAQPASWLTIRPIPGRITRLRDLQLTW